MGSSRAINPLVAKIMKVVAVIVFPIDWVLKRVSAVTFSFRVISVNPNPSDQKTLSWSTSAIAKPQIFSLSITNSIFFL